MAKAKTGVFPALHANGNPRIRSDGHAFQELRVRCIKDGNVRHFVDDGADARGHPNQQRQYLALKLTQLDEDGLPVFFVDEPTGFAINHHGIQVSPQVVNERIVEKMRRNMGRRSSRLLEYIEAAASQIDDQKAKAALEAERQRAQAEAAKNHNSDLLGDGEGPKRRGRPPKDKTDG